MPHLTARMPEAQLAGHEPALITALTDAVVQVYGEWGMQERTSADGAHTYPPG